MAAFPEARKPGVPTVATESATTIVDGVTLTNQYQASDVVDVREAREVTLLIDINAGSDGNIVSILPFGSVANEPAVGDDSWFSLPVSDGTVTAATLGQTLHTGADMTNQPEWGTTAVYPMRAKLPTSDAATDELRIAVPLHVGWCRWFFVSVNDDDGTGTLADATIQVVRSA